MGLLTPSNNEILLARKMFDEKTRLIGISCFYYEVKNYNLNYKNSLEKLEFFDKEELNIIFEDMPKIKTLKNLGWWDDNEDSVHPIAYMPWFVDGKIIKPCIGSRIEFKDPISGYSRFYEIAEVNANTYFMINYIVNLVPYRETIVDTNKQEEDQKGGNFYGFLNK